MERARQTQERIHGDGSAEAHGVSANLAPASNRPLDPALVGSRLVLWQRFELRDGAEIGGAETDRPLSSRPHETFHLGCHSSRRVDDPVQPGKRDQMLRNCPWRGLRTHAPSAITRLSPSTPAARRTGHVEQPPLHPLEAAIDSRPRLDARGIEALGGAPARRGSGRFRATSPRRCRQGRASPCERGY